MGIYLKMWNKDKVIINNFKMPYSLKIFKDILGHSIDYDVEYTIKGEYIPQILDFYGEMSNKIPNGHWIKNDLLNGIVYPLLNEEDNPMEEYKIKLI